MNEKSRLKHRIVSGLIQLNSYIEKDIKKNMEDIEFWEKDLKENGDIAFTDINPKLTIGEMYNKVVRRGEILKEDLEKNNRLIEIFKELEVI